jgi:4-amino-4-deoxy-L-arabinose transferase-like glycosyltransferase
MNQKSFCELNPLHSTPGPRIPRTLAWILLLSFLVRIATVVPAHAGGYGSDEKEYVFLAHQLLDGKGFVDSNGEYSIKAPLFPALLLLPVWLSGSSLLLPFLFVALLGSVSVFLGYLLALDLWGDRRVALLAAGLIAFAPPLVLYGALLMSENLFIALLLYSLLLARRLCTDHRISTHIIFGVVAALATLTRAVFLGLVPILLVAPALIRVRAGARPMRLLIAIGIWCLVLTPWTLRNYSIHNDFVPVSSFGGRSLLLGNNPYAHGTTKLDRGFQEWLTARLKERGVARADSLNEVQEIAYERSIALEYMTDHPAHTLALAIEKAFVFWIYPLSHQPGNHPLQAVLMAFDIIVSLSALVGIALAMLRGIRMFPFGIVLGFFTLVHAILHSEARYRLPLLPLLCILAGGILQAADRGNRRALMSDRRSRTIIASGMIILLLLYGWAGWIVMSGRD